MMQKIQHLLFTFCVCICSCKQPVDQSNLPKPVDQHATIETVALYRTLHSINEKGTLLGHQDALMYGHSWYGDDDRSDVKEMTGKHPGVVGWDLGHLEISKETNLDSVYFSAIKRQIKLAYAQGSIPTCSWHANNIATGGSTWDNSRNDVVKRILPGGNKHTEYLVWLDRLTAFFLDLKDNDGKFIPLVFRMYHEHTGSWFWWGKEQCSPDEYISLWKMTVDYLSDQGVHHLLYAYSSSGINDESEYLERYPGDDYVDIIGYDVYVHGDEAEYIEVMKKNLNVITQYAQKSGKVPVIAETGYESIPNPTYFSEIIYPLIQQYEVAWIHFWRNAWEPEKTTHFYLPFKGHHAEKDFVNFTSQPGILLQGEFNF